MFERRRKGKGARQVHRFWVAGSVCSTPVACEQCAPPQNFTGTKTRVRIKLARSPRDVAICQGQHKRLPSLSGVEL